MIDIKQLEDKEKALIVCLYYARIPSKTVEYKPCFKHLRIVAEKYNFEFKTLTNYKDAFDAQYENKRKGWNKKTLKQQSVELFNIFSKYKDTSTEDLLNAVFEILDDVSNIKSTYEYNSYTIKTKTNTTVDDILNNKTQITFDGLNIHKDNIKLNDIVFIVLGGDKPTWDTGLKAIGTVSKEPYDLGYDSNNNSNFKIDVKLNILLDNVIKRADLVPYIETFDIIGIGPMTKGEPNQAISKLEETKMVSLLRAILEISPNCENLIKTLVDVETFEQIIDTTTKLIPVDIKFGDELPNLEVINNETDDLTIEEYDDYTKEDFLDEVFFSENEYDNISELLEFKKNIILEGAPGVGKTYIAKKLAYSLIGSKNDSRIKFVQFHQSYSYEDFLIGYKPNGTGFEIGYGPFYDFCIKASKSKENHYFIIDEINRGNVSKIFGELLMLIEADKRTESINILYNKEKFTIPENLYIIGMMNTVDRGLSNIDYALRRRFSFYQILPQFESEGFKKYIQDNSDTKLKEIVEVIVGINKDLSSDTSLNSGFQIGHSYFCTKNKEDDKLTNEQLSMIIRYEIIPLLREFWFDDLEKVNKWEKKLGEFLND